MGSTWKRAIAGVAAVIAAMLVLGILAAVVLLHNLSFQKYLFEIAEHRASAAIGAPVEAKGFSLHLSHLALDLYAVRILGVNGHPDPPVFAVDHIRLRVKILSLVGRQWRLEDVVLDHPVAYVLADAQGNTNIPKPPPAGGQTDMFRLAVQHLRIHDGEIYYNDQKSAVDADLADLSFQSRFDNASPRYYGTLSYRKGHLRYDSYYPIPHALNVSFDAAPGKLTIPQATLTSGSSRLSLTAMVENYSQPRVEAKYEAAVALDEFRRAMKSPSLPVGLIQLKGTLKYQAVPNRPLWDSVMLQGEMSSPVLALNMPGIRDLSARYQLANGNAEVRDLHAHLFGGELNAALTVRDLAGDAESRLTATLKRVAAADLKQLAGARLRNIGLSGTVNANLEASWSKILQDLAVRGTGNLQATMTPPNTSARIPVSAEVQASYAAAAQKISLMQTYVRMPQTSILLNGTVSKRSSLQVRVEAHSLQELEALADAFQEAPEPLGLGGQASFTGSLRGSMTNPQIAGELTATNLRVRGTAWRLLRANLSLSPSEANLQNAVLEPAQQGRMTFNVRAGLRHWSFTRESPLAASIWVSQVQVAPFMQAANISYPVSGILSAKLSVRGSELNPAGDGTLYLKNGRVDGETVQRLDVRIQGNDNAINTTLTLQLPAGTVQGKAIYFPAQQGFEGTIQAASLQLDKLQVVKQRKMQIAGPLTIKASGRGTLLYPEAQLTAEAPQLQVEGRTISGLKLSANLQNQLAKLAIDSQMADAYVHGRATVELAGDYNVNSTLDTSNIPLQPLLAAYLPQAPDMHGNTEIHASLQGPLKKPALLNAHVEIPVLALNYRNVEVGAATPIRLDYTEGVLRVQRMEIRGTGTDLKVQGIVPLRNGALASLNATGTVDLQLIKILQPDIQSSGQLQFEVQTAGTLTNPKIQGQIRFVNANVQTLALPLGLQNANGVLTINNNRVDVTQFQGQMGGGSIQASGSVIYRPNLRFDLGVTAHGVRLLYPQGVRTLLETNLGLTGTTDAALLRGRVIIDRISFTPEFDLSTFTDQFNGEVANPPAQGLAGNVRLDVAVQTSTGLNLVSRTLSLQGGADLRVRGPASDPAITGRASLTGGDLIFLGNRYVIQGGTVDFINPVRTEPIVNLRATTTISQYNINLDLEGPVDRMRTSYTSNPALPPSDIIHLIAFGSTTAVPGQQATPASLGAESILANQVSGAMTGHIAKIAGISQFSIDPNLGSTATGHSPGPIISLQQRVTSKLYVNYSTALSDTQQQVFVGQYQISPRWSGVVTRDQNGGFGFDARFHKSF